MEPESFFLAFLEGTNEIVRSDKACADLIRWANKMSIAESSGSKLESVSAFLLLGLKSEIDRMVNSLKRYQRMLYDGSGKISDEEWKAIDEKNQLWDLEKIIPELLLEIARRATKTDANYLRTIEKYKGITYDGAPFRLETVKKMQRYFEVTILFLKSLDEANIELHQRDNYVSQIFEASRFLKLDAPKSNEAQIPKQALFNEEYHLDLLKRAELITFDGHIPRITPAGIDLLKDLYQAQMYRSLDLTPEEILKMPPGLKESFEVTEEKALSTFVGIGILDADSRTITDHGLKFLLGAVERAFRNGFTGVVVTSVSVDAREIEAKGIDIFDKFEPSNTALRKELVTAILKAI